jgi:multicomponent Na+:H+ antiporter subunit B
MKPLSVAVTTVFNTFSWFMIVFGVYVINNGHSTPGGGFQGGAIGATFLSFLLVAYGGKKLMSWVREGVYGALELIGLLAFVTFGFLGFPNSFLYNFLAVPYGTAQFTAWLPDCGLISLINVSVGFEVIGALSLIVVCMYSSVHMVETGAGMGGERGHDRFDR